MSTPKQSKRTGFAQWLAQQPGTDTQKAAWLRVSQSRLCRYKAGQRMPRPVELRRLMKITGLTADAFVPPAPARRSA